MDSKIRHIVFLIGMTLWTAFFSAMGFYVHYYLLAILQSICCFFFCAMLIDKISEKPENKP